MKTTETEDLARCLCAVVHGVQRPCPAATCIEQLQGHIPEALEFVDKLCGSSLRKLVTGGCDLRKKPVQDGEDLIAVASRKTARLLGPKKGAALERALQDNFSALTANHHGVDFHPEFFQGTLLFGLGAALRRSTAVPVFAVGAVPKHNVAYPRGILFGDKKNTGFKPGRFPVLPDTMRRTAVSLLPPLVATDVQRACARAATLAPSSESKRGVMHFLDKVFNNPTVLGLPTFSEQATVMNSLMWEEVFAKEVAPPPLVSLDFTLLSAALIQKDLADKRSFIRMLLEPQLARELQSRLNSVRGCWTFNKNTPSRGTFLFWHIDSGNRLIPMQLDAAGRLRSKGEEPLVLPLRAPDLLAALQSGRLLPGLYLTFAVSALARGLLCFGGVYQTGYLPAMRDGTAKALRAVNETALADTVAMLPGSPLLTGCLPLWCKDEQAEHPAIPAGPVEIIVRRSLGKDILERLASMPVETAFSCSLAYHYEDIFPDQARQPDWCRALRTESGIFLQEH